MNRRVTPGVVVPARLGESPVGDTVAPISTRVDHRLLVKQASGDGVGKAQATHLRRALRSQPEGAGHPAGH